MGASRPHRESARVQSFVCSRAFAVRNHSSCSDWREVVESEIDSVVVVVDVVVGL